MLSNAQEILVVRFAFAGGLKFGQDNVCYVVNQPRVSYSRLNLPWAAQCILTRIEELKNSVAFNS